MWSTRRWNGNLENKDVSVALPKTNSRVPISIRILCQFSTTYKRTSQHWAQQMTAAFSIAWRPVKGGRFSLEQRRLKKNLFNLLGMCRFYRGEMMATECGFDFLQYTGLTRIVGVGVPNYLVLNMILYICTAPSLVRLWRPPVIPPSWRAIAMNCHLLGSRRFP